MDIVSCKEMKAIEKEADERGVSYYEMMENAGASAFEYILEKSPSASSAQIFCGKGNNGGDGFVVARLMKKKGMDVEIILVDGEPKTEDAITNYDLIKDLIPIRRNVTELTTLPDVIIDAIYGTGFHGAFRESALEASAYINQADCSVYALDLPSGLSGDMTEDTPMENEPIGADCTIAFHKRKPVHICSKAAPYMGEVVIGDIGISHLFE